MAHVLITGGAGFIGTNLALRLSREKNIKVPVAKIGAVNMSALSAAHGGVKLLAKAGACELGPEKIRVNSIHPGLVDTYTDEEFKKNYPDSTDSLEYEKNSIAMIPFQRKGSSDEVAEAIRFLVSDESVFMTGAEITIDGGLVAQ